ERKLMAKTDIAIPIRGFFEQHLLAQRGLSGHTVLAYRDALKLFLEFVCRQRQKVRTGLTLEDLRPDTVRAFLDHLERVRKTSAPPRNPGRPALPAFSHYLAS